MTLSGDLCRGHWARFSRSAELVPVICAVGTFFEERGARSGDLCSGHVFRGARSSFRRRGERSWFGELRPWFGGGGRSAVCDSAWREELRLVRWRARSVGSVERDTLVRWYTWFGELVRWLVATAVRRRAWFGGKVGSARSWFGGELGSAGKLVRRESWFGGELGSAACDVENGGSFVQVEETKKRSVRRTSLDLVITAVVLALTANQGALYGGNDEFGLSIEDFGGRDLAEYSGEVDDGDLGEIDSLLGMVPVVANCGIGKTLSQLEEHRRFDELRESGEYGGDEVTECEVTANPVGDVWGRSIVLGLCSSRQAALGSGSTLVPGARDGGKSLCTVDRLTDLFEQGVFPEDLTIVVPKPHRRPWNPPKGYICVYEDYFTDGQLRFPLPNFLVQYCFRRGIAFSQLSLGSVRNAVGLMMLGNDCGVEVDTDLFEEATTFSVMADNPGLCQVNARSSHKIVHGVRSKVADWRRYYFYVQVSEISAPTSSSSLSTEWNLFPAYDPRPRKARNDISVGLRAIWTRGSLFWPGVIKSSCIHSPSRLEMGKASCRFPNYSDSFGVSGTVPSETEPIQIDEDPEQGIVQPQLVAEPQQDVGLDVSGRTAVDPGRRAVSEDRAARVSAARSGKKKVSGSTNEAAFRVPPDVDVSLRRKVSHGGNSRESSAIVRERGSSAQEVRGVDYSFSFNYDKKNEPFPVSRSSCGDFASKVYGSPREFPPVDSLLGMNLYQTWACKQIQSIGAGNALVDFYDRRAKDLEQETVALKAENKTLGFSAQNRLRALNSERGRVGSLEEQIEKLTAQLKKATAEETRLRDSRTSAVRYERNRAKEKITKYTARIERLRKHILDCRAAQDPLFMQCQATGTRKCLKKFIAEGLAVPDEKLAALKADKHKWRATVESLTITDLCDDDLDPFPELADDAPVEVTEAGVEGDGA
ncbi:hypothetical protein ISN44_As08g018350 [Arabidopsis suecica]|uniref:DUF1204 domain-containing protein n=1 Tax=Arabidopsis suecica TaxID=45249 RepID=A0A8T2B656_ARASU|nr:hypothetical protein ISN44_As08g018350 [Arabidopsis suecica]